jgi:hypothetical protein
VSGEHSAPPSETQFGAFGLPFVQPFLLSRVTTGRDPMSTFVVGKSPCGQVDCLKELGPTLRQKVLNVDTDFLSNPYKLAHEKEGQQQYLLIDICPCTLQIEL